MHGKPPVRNRTWRCRRGWLVVLGNLGSLFNELGDFRKAGDAANRFLERYPPTRAASFPAYGHYHFINVFLYVNMVSKESLEEGVSLLEKVAELNMKHPRIAVPALHDAGSLALQGERYDAAVKNFTMLAESFDPEFDNRVTLARFQLLSAINAKGEVEGAKVMANQLAQEFSGTKWEPQAQRWVNYFADEPLVSEMAPSPDPKFATSTDSSVQLKWVVLANVVAACVCFAFWVVYRRNKTSNS